MATKRTKRKVIRNPSSGAGAISTEQGIAAALKVVDLAVESDIDCALCGGIAMQIYGFTRATRDVDFLAAELLSLPRTRRLNFGGEAYSVQVGRKEIEVDWIVRDDDKQDVYEAALADAVTIEPEGLPIITPEWMVILKNFAGRGKDHLDLLWLLRQDDLVDRKLVESHVKKLFGRFAFAVLGDLQSIYLEADLMRARDEAAL
ncbi:MAG: hypothetical protein ACR2LC_17010 [Pyrinomonadaceae bacterium]